MAIFDVPEAIGVYVVVPVPLPLNTGTVVVPSFPAFALSFVSVAVAVAAPARRTGYVVGFNVAGSRFANVTYTVEGGDSVVVDVPPDTTKPLWVSVIGVVNVE